MIARMRKTMIAKWVCYQVWWVWTPSWFPIIIAMHRHGSKKPNSYSQQKRRKRFAWTNFGQSSAVGIFVHIKHPRLGYRMEVVTRFVGQCSQPSIKTLSPLVNTEFKIALLLKPLCHKAMWPHLCWPHYHLTRCFLVTINHRFPR